MVDAKAVGFHESVNASAPIAVGIPPHQPLPTEPQTVGNVTASLAAGVGFNAADYEKMVSDLADQQRAMDVHENSSGSRHPHAHDLHEKMIHAAKNLKGMVDREAQLEQKELPPFTIKIEQSAASNSNKVTLTLRLEGIMDRKQAEPVMGALVRAFRRKRKSAFGAHGDSHDDDHDLHVHDYHIEVSNLEKHGMEKLLDDLSKPMMMISNVRTHCGMVSQSIDLAPEMH